MASDHQQQQNHDLGNKNTNSSSSNGSYLCRQSISRWTPTSDQIRILKELYYNNGIRSPTADQIQRIAARLRHYGKIEGKNVFYWFQNHKARERQKKRFTPPHTMAADHHHMHRHVPGHFYNQIFMTPGVEGGGSSSQSFVPVGYEYGAVTTDKSFMECSISPDGESRVPNIHNLGSWVKIMHKDETHAHGEEESSDQIETLPLFPIHGGDSHDMDSSSSAYDKGVYFSGGNWSQSDSLELSLNSYGYYD